MGCYKVCCSVILLCFLFGLGNGLSVDQSASLVVNASQAGRKIPETLFGQFFEEINHAGAGGLWAELVSNRGFEAGGQIIPSNIDPWTVIGNESSINVSTDQSSCFKNNKIALRVEVLCDKDGSNICPDEGVGIYNPGFWGMNIEDGKTYNAVFYVSSEGSIDLSVALTASNGTETLASSDIKSSNVSSWTKIEIQLKAKGGNPYSRLQITTTQKGVIWFDQVSLMPADTFKGHGFRKDLAQMMADLKPRFLRFPGGCFVEGEWLRNAFRWKATVGPWEERPGHFGDVWMYWTDDGLGYLEFLQLAEDLETEPVWVFNNGVSHNDQVDTSDVLPFVQEALDGLEFARGSPNSTWGSLRAKLGHPEPFDLKYVAVGNEDCGKKNYRGNYLKFYNAIRRDYPDIKIITNCDGSTEKLDHPADIYDYHIYTSASNMFSMTNYFDRTSREGPKAFISEYAVTEKNDIGNGTLLAALGEAGFLIGVEKNSDIVEMASYAPLFVNTNDRRWNPDAIVFDSSRAYGTPSYWMQQFFAESSGATLHDLKLNSSTSNVVASAISYKSSKDNQEYLKIKIVNFGSSIVNLKLSVEGYNMDSLKLSGIIKTVLTSGNVMDENSFQEPKKVTPVKSSFEFLDKKLEVSVDPNSLTSFDILKVSSHLSTMTRILPQDVHHKE